MSDPTGQSPEESISLLPVEVTTKVFHARPSSVPEVRDFLRRCLAGAALAEADSSTVAKTVFQALLTAAGTTGAVQVCCRTYPSHIEIDVCDVVPGSMCEPVIEQLVTLRPRAHTAADFGAWLADALRREGISRDVAASQLDVSVKTVSRWIGGETEPRLRELRRIQERFGEVPFS
ncbi:helix-turn-helix domain-containing protein [Kutzneria kofuensis]|uniref:HTH cro/C1-type domain-containing protein n=1 Tax=Kutzneria kofuensis TaxID=103725 RepID=A0A7W9KC92_9PSEU|nr:helix-turn-helix transcriptional regulator [Kutzneria kofuensis]MBB5889872.1 hypothetical protein [Kutzneria kofuensis]